MKKVKSDPSLKNPSEPGFSTPDLSGLNRENPFAVPQGYFESLSSDVFKKINAIPDVESTSSENPFIVPAGYFESLPERVLSRIQGRVIWYRSAMAWILRPQPRYALAMASFVLLILFSINYFTRTVQVEYASQKAVPEPYYESVLAQLDEAVLSEVYSEEIFPADNNPLEDYEEYLLENDIDLNSLSEHL